MSENIRIKCIFEEIVKFQEYFFTTCDNTVFLFNTRFIANIKLSSMLIYQSLVKDIIFLGTHKFYKVMTFNISFFSRRSFLLLSLSKIFDITISYISLFIS